MYNDMRVNGTTVVGKFFWSQQVVNVSSCSLMKFEGISKARLNVAQNLMIPSVAEADVKASKLAEILKKAITSLRVKPTRCTNHESI